MNDGSYKILLVEDNPGDVLLIQEALDAAHLCFELTHCDSVQAALRTISMYVSEDITVPDLLLLDYNLPGGDAREVLKAATTNPKLMQTRKAVITSSMSPHDREDALQNGAECVIPKPAELDLFLGEVGGAISRLLTHKPSSPDTNFLSDE